MSKKANVGVAVLLLLGCAAGALYWGKERGQTRARAAESPDVSGPEGPAPAEAPVAPPPSTTSTAAGEPEGKGEPPVDPGLPLRAGEVLEYTANVSSLSDVAQLTLQIGQRKDFFGRNAWHLQAFAHTENPLRMVFALDDQFDSYSDASSMDSLQYEMHLDERGQKVNSVQRMTTTGKEPAPPNATETRVRPGTRDPLGLLEFLRHVDWTKTTEVNCPVYDGHKLYEVTARLMSKGDAVSVPVGNYKASKIEIHVFDNGQEMKDAQFAIFIANNVAHTPVLLEAVMPFATARVELTKAR
jgi:Protein of unknown function (DUF3108)